MYNKIYSFLWRCEPLWANVAATHGVVTLIHYVQAAEANC
jgi:hypothetical protein